MLPLVIHEERREGRARDVLHNGDGALADERDRHRMGAHAVARDAAGGVGGVDESRKRILTMRSLKAGSAALVVGLLASGGLGSKIDDWTDLIGVYFFGVFLLMIAVGVTIWIFGPPRDLADREDRRSLRTDAGAQLDAAQTLTTAYSKVLQTPRDHFWPLSTLPADKEVMKAALKLDAAFQARLGVLDKLMEGGTATLRDGFISTYAMLADFVSDDLAARVNPYWKYIRTQGERVKSGEQLDAMASAKELTRLVPSEADKRASEQAHDEFKVLAEDMTAYLERIASRNAPKTT